MKLIPKIAAFMFLIGMLTACTSEKSTEQMLKDDDKRKEIMSMISEDSEMMKEMHEHMKGTKYGRMKDTTMVMDSKWMAKKMAMIMDKMEEDSVMCMEMAELMMNNKHMKSVMMTTCEQAGMTMGKGMGKMEDHMKMHPKKSM